MSEVSLIIPLYNAAEYLRPCLDSVAAQTFTGFECLCVNDGSTDDTGEIIEEYAKKDKRFVLINQPNSGVSEARNAGLETAGAKHVAFLDSDDMLHPQALEVLYTLITGYKTDIAGFTFKKVAPSFEMPETTPIYDLKRFKVKVSKTPLNGFLKLKRSRGGFVEVWTRIYRKAALTGVQFPKGVFPAEDAVFTIKAFAAASTAAFVKAPLLYYRKNSANSVMAKGVTEKYLKSHTLAVEEIHRVLLKSKISRQTMDAYIAQMVFKSFISRLLKRESSKLKALSVLARNLVQDLRNKGIFNPKALSLRRRIVSGLFIKGRFRFARFAQM